MDETLKVLVVDDEPGMRSGTERALRRHTLELADLQATVRYQVETAATGEAALEAVAAAAPDILLLDYKLPGISGLEVQDRLVTQHVDVLTIMVSACSSLQTVITATERGAFDFLVKPFTPDELREALRKAAQHVLVRRQAQRLAEERKQIRFEFIRVLGHELKAPLAAIEGYLRLLQEADLGQDVQAYQQVADRSLVRIEGMRKLILDLLDLTRIESGNKQRVLAEVRLREAVDAAVETVRSAAAEMRISLAADVPDGLDTTADRGEIDIILNNLLSNAVKYNREGGQVRVRVRQEGQHTLISVADTGIGMTAAEAAKLFGEFVRIRNERTADVLGSGLGLSIVKKLASLYDGDVTVQSQPDVGSTFTVSLETAGHAQSAKAQPATGGEALAQ